jgi:hypothetical protein
MKKWKYKTHSQISLVRLLDKNWSEYSHPTRIELDKALNKIGKEGWELINIHNNNPKDIGDRFTNYYFKKEIK